MKQKRLRVLKILGWSVLALLLALYVGLPTGMAIAAVWPSRAYVGEPPAGFREVPLTTEDGVELVAWYAPPNNGAVLILAHGAGGSREGGRQLATALAEYGFGVLSLDLRGHGESTGRTNRLGWQGTTDIRAAVDYITAHEGDVAIGGVGLSMGGEVLLGASATCPEVTAIVADGATRRCTEELIALPSKRPFAENFTSRVMYGAVQLFSGERPPTPLLDEMARSTSTRFLLIAAGNNDLEVAFNERFSDVIGARAQVWVVPDVDHVGARARHPRAYEKRLVSFFEGALSGESPESPE